MLLRGRNQKRMKWMGKSRSRGEAVVQLRIYDSEARAVIHKEKTMEELLYEEGREECDVSLGRVMFEIV